MNRYKLQGFINQYDLFALEQLVQKREELHWLSDHGAPCPPPLTHKSRRAVCSRGSLAPPAAGSCCGRREPSADGDAADADKDADDGDDDEEDGPSTANAACTTRERPPSVLLRCAPTSSLAAGGSSASSDGLSSAPPAAAF
jgi:hypothetical protein